MKKMFKAVAAVAFTIGTLVAPLALADDARKAPASAGVSGPETGDLKGMMAKPVTGSCPYGKKANGKCWVCTVWRDGFCHTDPVNNCVPGTHECNPWCPQCGIIIIMPLSKS